MEKFGIGVNFHKPFAYHYGLCVCVYMEVQQIYFHGFVGVCLGMVWLCVTTPRLLTRYLKRGKNLDDCG